MNRTVALSLLVVFGLSLSAVPFAIAKGEVRGPGEDGPGDDHGKEGPRTNDGDKGPREPGRIQQVNGSYNGRYVDFSVDFAACAIHDIRVYNQTFFVSIVLGTPCDKKPAGAHGSEFSMRAGDSRIMIHDAPNGLLKLDADENHGVHVQLASGVVANKTAKGFELSVGNLSGLFRVDEDNASIDFTNATSGDLTGKASFWVHPKSGESKERQEIHKAMKDGKVGGEIDVLADNGTVSTEVLSYDDVIIKAGKKDNSSFRFLVDGNLTEGRTFVVNMGPGVFRSERIGIRYYDVDNTSLDHEVAIAKADGLQDVLSIDAGEGPEYWVVKDEAGLHVLVAVPHFSVHAFEIQSLAAEVAPIIIGGVVAAIVVVALVATDVLRPRRK